MDAKIKSVEYVNGQFVDYAGNTHTFVLCAILSEVKCFDIIARQLQFGVSFCNPTDKHNEELGKKIAYGKALKNRDRNRIIGRAGLLNNNTVKYIIASEVKHIAEFPEQYSKKYKLDKEKFLTNKKSV